MNHESLRVLMVEDSEDDVLLIIRELKKGGYNPVYERVETSVAMKKALKEKQWDIILCDYKMPKFSGSSAIVLLKKANINIPIIIVSGAIGEETAAECMRLGAQDYIMKGNFFRLCPAIAREIEEAEVRSKQKQTEEKLRDEEQLFRALAEQSSDIIILVNQELVVTYENQALGKYLGYKPEEIIGKNAFEHIHPDDLKLVTDIFDERFTDINAPASQIEIRIRHKDGSWHVFEATGSNLVRDNVVEATIVNLRDITERKKAEEALRKSEDKYRRILEDIQEGYFEVDLAGNYTFFNDSLCRIHGYSREELLGMNNRQYTDKETAKKVFQKFNNVYKTGEPLKEIDWQITRKDGTKRYIEASVSLLKDSSGKPTGFRGITRDITERNQTEGELKKSEEKYRDIFKNAMEGIYQSTTEGRFITVNEALARMAGYDSPEELIESIKNIGTQLYVHPEDRKRFLEIRAKKGFVNNFEVEFYKKDGSTFWVVINARTVKNEQGKILYTEGLIEDITLRKHAEEQLHKSLESLKRAVGVTIQVLVSVLEVRDPYTAGHQSRSADLARAIATEMGLSQDRIEGIRMAGIIHDIGKLAIPAEILTKPTKLTDLEFSLIKEHSKSGYEMLKDVESPWPLAEIVHQHHERMNGSGYPRNLKVDEILMESRILAVADVVEAMASHRPYRSALGIKVALEEIEKNKGILYDDAVADACLRLFREKGYQLK